MLALRDGRLFLHRLVGACTPVGFRLRGDSMPGLDPWFHPEALLGRLTEPKNRSLPASLSRAAGLIFCHLGVARRLALNLHSQRTRLMRVFRNMEAL